MDKKTQKITMGAAILAIFAIMLLLNRQTGSFFEEFFLFLFPIPMVAYSAKYGWKSSLPVLVGMGFFSFLFGTFTTIFYAVSEAIIGMVFGDCIHRKVDSTKTLFSVMILSAIVNVLNTIVLADLFGMNLEEELQEMQQMLEKLFENTNIQMPPNFMSENFMMQMMVISMVLLGIMQGFVIYELSLLILRRLQFQVQKPKSVYLYFPAKWTAYAAALGFLAYYVMVLKQINSGTLYNIVQVAGTCGNLYLVFFGFMGIMFYCRIYRGMNKMFGILMCVAAYCTFAIVLFGVGFVYIATDYHLRVVKEKNMIG